MGGSSSKSRSSTTNKDYVFNNVDYRTATGERGIMEGNTSLNFADRLAGDDINGSVALNIEKTDYGAIETGGELAMRSLDLADEVNERSLQSYAAQGDRYSDLTRNLVEKSLGIVADRAGNQQEQLVDDFKTLFSVLVLGTGGTIIAIYYFRSRR